MGDKKFDLNSFAMEVDVEVDLLLLLPLFPS